MSLLFVSCLSAHVGGPLWLTVAAACCGVARILVLCFQVGGGL
jgi:hypothetical protein